MRLRLPSRAAFSLFIVLALARAAAAGPIRLVASDARGATLELTLADYRLGPPGPDGRTPLVLSDLPTHGLPGRPLLPVATTLLALPPGSRPVVGTLEGGPEEVRDGVRLSLGERRGFGEDPEGMGLVPTAEPAEPIRDGPWPTAPVELGAVFTLRGQRMVAVSLHPIRYDEASGRLWARRRMRVRVDFAGGTPSTSTIGATGPGALEDRHWDPVLRAGILNYEQGRSWRSPPARAVRRGRAGGAQGSLFDRAPLTPLAGAAGVSAAAQFDESDPEVRVRIDSTGVYSLTYDQLAARGYPAGVPISEVSVHRHEFLEDSDPAYETIELPIEVDEGTPANGIFDSGDRIVVYVQSWAERSGVSMAQREWGDGEVVYATRVARGGLRIGSRSGWRDAIGLVPQASYPWTQRWEKSLVNVAFPGVAPAETLYDQFMWNDIVYYYVRPDTFLFETNHLDASRPVNFTVAWQGRKNGLLFYTWAQVRNGSSLFTPVADSLGWFGKVDQLASAVLPGGALTEGRTNGLIEWARNGSSPANPNTNAFANVSLNWFQATYWRAYRALAGILPCNSGDASDVYEILATGFSDSSALRAYDVTDPQDPRRLTNVRREFDGTAYALRFQDSTATGVPRRYVVFNLPKPVPAANVFAVTRRDLASRGAGDYLLIAPEIFLGAVQPLVALRQGQGIDVALSPLESVFDEFNGGRRSAWAIKRYIRYALNNWGAKFVLLVGDASDDPNNFVRDSGPDVVPVMKIPGPVGVNDGRQIVPSDGWYVWCLNGCPPDPVSGARPPILPELFIGRLPATTPQEVADMVAKLVAYENYAPSQTWRNQLLLFSDDQFSGLTTFGGGNTSSGYCFRPEEAVFHLLNATIRSAIVDSAGLGRSDVEMFNLADWLANEPVDVNNCRPDMVATQNRTRATVTPALLSRLNAGRMWWNYQGHANEYVLAHENFYRNVGSEDDKDLLVNDGKPFLFSAFSCHVNGFANVSERRPGLGPPIGEELMLLPRGGAIASWASSGYEIIPGNGTDHVNVSWARAMFLDPPHDDLLGNGDLGARTVLGETIALGLIRFVPGVQFDPTENGVALTYTLLGDPATRLSIGVPQALVTANGDTVINDRPVALAPPRDTLHLEADLVSSVQIRSIALLEQTAGGTRTLPDTSYTLTPAFPDTAAAGLGGRRYHLSFTTPLRPGVLRYTLRTVDRYGLSSDFDVVFQFFTQLRVSGNALAENDAVVPSADLSLLVVLPTPVSDPQTQLKLAVDSLAQAFTATPLDTVGRIWTLGWTHAPYGVGTHQVSLTAEDSLTRVHHFRVLDALAGGGRLLRDVMAFPNPFDEQIGTTFSLFLLSDGPADVLLRVFTVSGRMLYQRVERAMSPGYHQWPWDGIDAEGARLANGVYLYKIVATTGSRSDTFDGRLVKLRKPRRNDTATP